MNSETNKKANYDYLADYVQGTKGDNGEISGLMTAIIAQFLQSVKKGINIASYDNDGYLNGAELVQIMIAELRKCVVDLELLLNSNKDIIQ